MAGRAAVRHKLFVLIMFIIFSVLHFPILSFENPRMTHKTNSAYLTAAVTRPYPSTEENENRNKDEIALKQERMLEELRKKKEMLSKIIVIGIVGVLFLVCAYWWTYGKLHHKLPKL